MASIVYVFPTPGGLASGQHGPLILLLAPVALPMQQDNLPCALAFDEIHCPRFSLAVLSARQAFDGFHFVFF